MVKIRAGQITVFGKEPGSSEAAIPGSGVGYMPQEISLYPDLTIRETLQYFASLYGLSSEHCSQRVNFLVDFLNLPDKGRFVGKLSGGQKRRVSLATALIHKPVSCRAPSCSFYGFLFSPTLLLCLAFAHPRRAYRWRRSVVAKVYLGSSYRTEH